MQDTDIVIIGAGAAGIGAARRLVDSGLRPLVIEALPRAGGRGWTRAAAGAALDMGCGWLHSAGRNAWVGIAEAAGIPVQRREAAWGAQYRNLGFSVEDRAAARDAFERWSGQLALNPPASDCAADLLEPGGRWNAYIQALSGYISGDELERISAADYLAYDEASTYENWRLPGGYGALIAGSLPPGADVWLATPVSTFALDGPGVRIETSVGTLRARAAIVTVSTHVLAGDSITWPPALDPWREAARCLPLGRNEKLFFEIVGNSPFEPETHVIGNPHDAATGSYYIRAFGQPVIECFLGGAGARAFADGGTAAAFERAMGELVGLFGASVRTCLRPLAASDWAGTASIGGGYSHALPGRSQARLTLARPFEDRVFFAGEATHPTDYSTAHGALQSGIRAADEARAALNPGTALR